MVTITDVLKSEHATFAKLFDEVERLLAETGTVAEIRLLCRLVEGVLSRHADTEQQLAYAALDHALEEQGALERLHQDHDEISTHLQRAKLATEAPEAIQLLKLAIKASRDHFDREERTVFPLFAKLFQTASLEELGAASLQQTAASARAQSRKRPNAACVCLEPSSKLARPPAVSAVPLAASVGVQHAGTKRESSRKFRLAQ